MKKILIVEDDPQISKSLRLNLRFSGYEALVASSCAEAWASLKAHNFDLMCLDVGLPDGNGIDFCQKVRESGDETPILFISALTEEATVVKAISRGGDDYIRKPFGVEELKVRMQKVIRRFGTPSSVLSVGELKVDPGKRLVTFTDQIIHLGRKELDILMILMKRQGDVVTRESILSLVYDNLDTYDRTIDSHMSHLRKKLRDVAGQAIQINSVYGTGYRLEHRTC